MNHSSAIARTLSKTAYEMVCIVFRKKEINHTVNKTDLERIRNSLLQSLDRSAVGKLDDAYFKVSEALDIEQLWYSRADVMSAVARECGELVARSELLNINNSFKGFLPKGLTTRPSPLDS